MDLRSTIIAVAMLCLLFSATQPISAFHGEVDSGDSEEEIYEIDYRGPETHRYLPPPGMLRSTRKKDARPKPLASRNGGNN